MGLTTAIRRVITQQQTVTIESMPVRTNGDIQPVNLTIVPLSDTAAMEGLMLVLLEETGTATIVETAVSSDDSSSSKDQHIAKLEQDLQASEAYLRVAVEELDTAFEELKSTNEELQSSNEELQSSNEEMETSKEELQSINEELITVNAELQQKNEALTQAYDVMNNLIASTQIGTIFLDLNMRVQRFTPEVTQIINLIQTDIGRPMNHIVSKLKIDRLTADVQGVLDTLVPTESEVETEDGNWYLVRTSLYRTLENIIGGVVITFRDITTQKKAYNLSRLATVVRDANDAITMIDFSGQILAWNPKAEQIYGWSEAEALTMNIRDIVPANKQADALTVVERVAQGENVDSLETVRLCKNGRIVRVRLAVTELVDEAGQPYAISTTEQVLHNEDDRP